MVTVSALHIYPIKSTAGRSIQQSQLDGRGLYDDRRYAIVDPDGQIITAREAPRLLGLRAIPNAEGLMLEQVNSEKTLFVGRGRGDVHRVDVFDRETQGMAVDPAVDAWLSAYLERPCRLVFMNETIQRPVLARHGGASGDVVSYADQCPILLISEASLADLNSRLEMPVTMRHFRPNIVVTGCDAFAEDLWSRVVISGTTYRVSQRCERCVFTTIDPDTFVPSRRQEPLRTLATYRRLPAGGVGFGVHLVPQNKSSIGVGDEVVVEE